jgi:hypothetical protein
MFPRNIDSILDILTNFTIIPNGDYGEVESGFQRVCITLWQGSRGQRPLEKFGVWHDFHESVFTVGVYDLWK